VVRRSKTPSGTTLQELTYQPMQEVLKYLRRRLQTYICTGGGQDFGACYEQTIPPEQIVAPWAARHMAMTRMATVPAGPPSCCSTTTTVETEGIH